MRLLLLVSWLMVPVLFGAYHYGPGQDRLRLDDVADQVAQAERHVAAEEWADAVEAYEEALRLLAPEQVAASRRLRLERDKAQMLAKQLPEANLDLKNLVDELRADKKAEPKLLTEALTALASSQYYMTWLMRLEGLSQDIWEPEIEAARQTYRLLAEEAKSEGATRRYTEDLESAVRLARMDPGELQGLPLPSQ